MPLYDYKCTDCEFTQEYLDKKKRKEKVRECSQCGEQAERVEVSQFSPDLKGKGFKVTDYPTIDRLIGSDAEKKWQKYESKYLRMKRLIETNPGQEVVRGDDGNYKLSD